MKTQKTDKMDIEFEEFRSLIKLSDKPIDSIIERLNQKLAFLESIPSTGYKFSSSFQDAIFREKISVKKALDKCIRIKEEEKSEKPSILHNNG